MTHGSPESTTQAAPSIAIRTATAASWLLVWRMTTRLLGLVNTVVLVRLLAPADFGLVALATSLSMVAEALSSIGIGDALMRDPEFDRDLLNTGFTLNILRGAVIAAGLAAMAMPAAHYFSDTRMATVMWALAAMVGLSTLENVGVVEFRRDFAFQRDFLLAAVPRLASIFVSIGLAVAFRNYWALIGGLSTNRLLRVALSYWLHPFRPSLTLRRWRRLSHFSFWTWASAIVAMIRDRMDTVAIGRVFGSASVGIYAVGFEIGTLIATEMVEPFAGALYAGFNAGIREGSDIGAGYLKAISATFLLSLPAGAGIAILAEPLIRMLFGENWLAAVPLVQIFALVYMMRVIGSFSSVMLNALGLIHVSFRVVLLSVAVRIVLLIALIYRYGLIGVAYGAAIALIVEELGFTIVCFRHLRLRVARLASGVWRCSVATVAMVAVLYAIGIGGGGADTSFAAMARIAASGTVVGFATYAAALTLLWMVAGRPEGPETIVSGLIGGAIQRVARR